MANEIEARQYRNWGDLPKIYAHLAEMFKNDLMRQKGLSEQDATEKALEMVSEQASRTLNYLTERGDHERS